MVTSRKTIILTVAILIILGSLTGRLCAKNHHLIYHKGGETHIHVFHFTPLEVEIIKTSPETRKDFAEWMVELLHQDRALGATYQLLADIGLYANQWSSSLLEEAREYTRSNDYSEKLGISVVAGKRRKLEVVEVGVPTGVFSISDEPGLWYYSITSPMVGQMMDLMRAALNNLQERARGY